MAHGIDLRTSLLCSFWKEIAFRDRVCSIRFGMDPQDLPTKVICISSGSLVIPAGSVGPFIQVGRALRRVRCVVTCCQVKISILVKDHSPTSVTTDLTLGRYFE